MEEFSIIESYRKLFSHWTRLNQSTKIFLITINIVTSALASCLNIPICYVIFRNRKYQTTENFVTLNLFHAGIIGAFANILVVVCCICDACSTNVYFRTAIVMLTVVNLSYTVLSVVIIAVHRAMNIGKIRAYTPTQVSLGKRVAVVLLPTLFSFATPFVLPVMFYFQVDSVGIFLLTTMGVIILTVVACYVSIIVQIVQSIRRLKQDAPNTVYKKAFMNITRILLVFFLTYTLLFVKGFLIVTSDNTQEPELTYIDFIARTLQSMGGTFNPLVYFYSQSDLRKDVLSLTPSFFRTCLKSSGDGDAGRITVKK